MKLYKLTDEHGRTRNDTQWGPGVSHTAAGLEGQPLCSDGWIHAYESPDIAVLMNPCHANFRNPRLWEAEGEIGVNDKGLKCGCRTLTTIREIDLPTWTTTQRVAFAIGCARHAYEKAEFTAWAEAWLSGADRSREAAAHAVRADVAAAHAVRAAYAATYAADAAAYAVDAAAAYAAYAADSSAAAAAIDFSKIIEVARGVK